MGSLPVKFRMLQLIFQNESISDEKLLALLKKEYSLDRHINEKGVGNYLISLKAVGMIELTDANFDKLGNLKQLFKVTKYGADRMIKYIDNKPEEQLNNLSCSS